MPTVPAPVVAQSWRGGSRQALLSRLLAGCDVEALDDGQTRSVGLAEVAHVRPGQFDDSGLEVGGEPLRCFVSPVAGSRAVAVVGARCRVELTAAVERHAGQLARTHALRGTDAVHLASALALADPDLVIAAWNRRLHAGAAAAGLHVAPADLPR